MSRIGKKPVQLPKGVSVTVKDGRVVVRGPKGELVRQVPEHVDVKATAEVVQVTRRSDAKDARACHGLMRALVNNMVTGVTRGYERKLEINGVGYRAEVTGQKITLALGFSHPVVYDLPPGVSAKVEKNVVVVQGIDRQLVGQTASKVRSFRPPEPYQGKGVKYVEEVIRRKVGKTGAA